MILAPRFEDVSAPTSFGRGKGFSGVSLGVEYGTCIPGVKRVIDMANVDCSGLVDSERILGGGTGI
jgi:hypothetical protein